MKKYFCIFLAFAMAASFIGCNGNHISSASQNGKTANESASGTLAKPEVRTFPDLGFSFIVPKNWDTANYTTNIVEGAVMDKQQVEYSYVDFLFQGDKEKPLLRIMSVPKEWWDDVSSMPKTTDIQLITERDDTAYLYTIPVEGTASQSNTNPLYKAMFPLRDDVINGFSLLKLEQNTLDCVLEDGAMQSITVKTDDNQTLSFDKQSAKVIAKKGLIIGQRLRLTYTGKINGIDTTTAKLLKIEVIG